MGKSISYKDAIDKSIQMHGNKYDYSLITNANYINTITKVDIICPEHGKFQQKLNAHYNGAGCKRCASDIRNKKKIISLDDVLLRFKRTHGDTYDYSEVYKTYVCSTSKVKIICPRHGDFFKIASEHYSGAQCQECSKRVMNNDKIIPLKEYIARANNKHKGVYDYSLVKDNYNSSSSLVDIICPVHGVFQQSISGHIKGMGCPQCVRNNSNKNKTYSYVDIIDKFKDIHHDVYDYSLITEENYNNTTYKIKIICKTHGEFEQICHNHIKGSGCPQCFGNYPSILEQKIHNILDDLCIEYETSNRTLISPQELDIYIPKYKVAIECNGVYWHSDIYKNDMYHLDKTKKCLDNDVQLLHFWEHELENKLNIISSIIKAKINNTEKIYARKCVIKEITDTKISAKFQNDNHLQGAVGSSIKLGLYYEHTLVALMTFGKPRFNKNYKFELLRFCNKLDTTIIGGASKLFNYFINNYLDDNDKVISYANRRISNGNLYKKLKFIELTPSEPSYFYTKGSYNIIPRYQAQKHKLLKLLGAENFNINLTESENMKNAGYNKVYDCGNLVFEYHKQNKEED